MPSICMPATGKTGAITRRRASGSNAAGRPGRLGRSTPPRCSNGSNKPRRNSVASSHEITRILAEWDQNPQAALEQLTPLVYNELRRLAASCLRSQRPDHTLQPTALVHEAYLRL